MNKFISSSIGLLVLLFGTIYASHKHVEEGRRLILEEAVFFNRQMNFNIFGCGGSFFDGKINKLELTLESNLQCDLNQSRELFSVCLLDWLNKINNDEKAKFFLKEYPFKGQNLDLRIIFRDYDIPSSKDNPKIAFVFNCGDKIVYCHRDKDSGLLKAFSRDNLNDIQTTSN